MIIAGAYTLIALVTLLGIGAALRRFGFTFLGCLMDTGDGQGGVPARREEAAATRAFQSCHRCHTANAAFACRCDTDCYAPDCHGGYRPLDPDPALGCRFCGPPFDAQAECGCASACKDPNCGWNAWQAAAMTEEWER